jgi:L-methionine (R)-S-oxide reductase
VTDWTLVVAQLAELIKGEPDRTANLANAAALLMSAMDDLNWAGFYLVGPAKGGAGADELVLGPFQGKPACIRLPFNKGVCGTAWARNETLVVADVHQFPGHIACDSASESEIVVPLRDKTGRPYGVLDLDSPRKNRFNDADRAGLESFCKTLEGPAYWSQS